VICLDHFFDDGCDKLLSFPNPDEDRAEEASNGDQADQ
jgi:hypothetical protein